MITPRNRKEFERHLDLLKESIIKKTYILNSKQIRLIRSLKNIRNAPNGRMNFQSVNETARLRANSQASTPLIKALLAKQAEHND